MKTIAAVMVVVLAFAGCGGGDAGTGITDERFVEVVVQLRRAAQQSHLDPEAFAARREQILQEAGVTEEELRAYIDAHGRDLDHMAAIWDTINARLAGSESPE
jgi:hypothetical protein